MEQRSVSEVTGFGLRPQQSDGVWHETGPESAVVPSTRGQELDRSVTGC